MDTDRMKKAAQWFYGQVFQDEAIRPRQAAPEEKLPSLLRAARSLEPGVGFGWQSRESVFLKQAKLLADYEDDYEFRGSVIRYYPTYQSLTDRELRGYFSWRSHVRRGDVQKTSLSFAFLYIYELLNQVGVAGAMEGYCKLVSFRDVYGALDDAILPYLNRWTTDYVIYYGLDPRLLANTPQACFDRSVALLETIHTHDSTAVIQAVKQLAPKWLERSKFYREYASDCDRVIFRVLCRVWDHYAARCKKSFTEQYFGTVAEAPVRLFDAAVFLDQQKKQNREYVADPQWVYRCRGGLWTVRRRSYSPNNAKLNDLLKTIDAVMRQEYAYPHPIQCTMDTKWVLKLIQDETLALLAEKKAAEAKRITIDYSQLAKIRREAAVTQDKLTVDEEWEEEAPELPPPTPAEEAPPDTPLSPAEYRLLQSLLYGRDLSWVQSQGLMLSVLVDGINEKLYDTFLDSVLEDTPALIEDYINDLKEMIHP